MGLAGRGLRGQRPPRRAAYLSPTQRDWSFGKNGLTVIAQYDNYFHNLYKVVSDADTITVATGYRVYRILMDGSTDGSFAPITFPAQYTPTDTDLLGWIDFAIDGDDGLLLASDQKVWRYDTNGTLDTSFGLEGRIRPGLGYDRGFTITRIVARGPQFFLSGDGRPATDHEPTSVVGLVARSTHAPKGVPTLTAQDLRVTEGSNGTKTVVATVALDRDADTPDIDVDVALRSLSLRRGDAEFGSDFTGGEAALKSPRAIEIAFRSNGDRVPEADETIDFELSNPAWARLDRDHGTVTLLNDDFGGIQRVALVGTLTPFGGFRGGASVTSLDPFGLPGNGDAIAVAADTGGSPLVRLTTLPQFSPLGAGKSFFAYDEAFRGGVRVAALARDAVGDRFIVTAPGPGGGPHVIVWNLDHSQPSPVASFLADSPDMTSGLFVAGADVDGDGIDEIVTSTDAGRASTISVFKLSVSGSVTRIARFAPYAAGFTGGVRVAGADIDGDGKQELVTAPGPGGAPQVRVFHIANGNAIRVASFLAYDLAFRGGVSVSAADIDADAADEVMTTPVNGNPHVVINDFVAGQRLVAFQFMAGTKPLTAAFARLDGNSSDNFIVTATGPGSPVTVGVGRLVY